MLLSTCTNLKYCRYDGVAHSLLANRGCQLSCQAVHLFALKRKLQHMSYYIFEEQVGTRRPRGIVFSLRGCASSHSVFAGRSCIPVILWVPGFDLYVGAHDLKFSVSHPFLISTDLCCGVFFVFSLRAWFGFIPMQVMSRFIKKNGTENLRSQRLVLTCICVVVRASHFTKDMAFCYFFHVFHCALLEPDSLGYFKA